MRQQEKQAAAAARELLKAESSRQRRAAQSRKGPVSLSMRKGTAAAAPIGKPTVGAAATQMRKPAGGPAAAPELGSMGLAAPRPEQNGAGGSGCASPTSFADGAASSIALAASSPAPVKAPCLNRGAFLNLQIQRHGIKIQHLLVASQILSSLICLRIFILWGVMLSLLHSSHRALWKIHHQKKK
nr:uncharacterized protein LOC117856082 [Setaria viridis]